MGKQICEEVLPYSCETKLCMSPTMMIRRVARNSQWGDVRGGGGGGGLGAEPPAFKNFAFFCKNNFILGLF